MSNMTEKIKASVDLREAMERYGISFNRLGYALCPFHREDTASLSIKNGRFTCFGCGASGDVIDFVRRYFNLDFPQALIRLNNDFGLGLTAEKPTAESRAMAREKAKRQKLERAQQEMRRSAYLRIAGAHAKLMRSGADPEFLSMIEGWLDENIEMVVVR